MTIQIAIKLTDELVGEVDRLVERGDFASRSQAIRTGLEGLVADRRRQELDRRYRDAMARFPETDEEIVEARRSAVDAINEEPWERWW
jgi:Arc/MetJ-type ribon-helix-helix transcriptional regulator